MATQALVTVLLTLALQREGVIRFTGGNAYGWPAARAVLVVCLLLAAPWKDRRGQPPPDARRTVAIAFAFVAAAEALGLLAPPGEGYYRSAGLRAVLVVIAAAGVVAGVRLLVNVRGARTTFGWFAAAAFAGAIVVAATVMYLGDQPTPTPTGTSARVLMALCEGAFLLAGTLNAIQLERTRLRRASDRATEVMEGRAEIASIVAHDVRGPAGTIRSVAGSLRTSYTRLGDPERLEFVGMIEQESLRLLRVADQMSLGLKADAGTLAFTLEDREVEGAVLQGVHEADAGPREVRTDFEPGLLARIDARWTAEAVRQGLENALRFSPADTPIDVRTRAEGPSALIEIEDRGPGIPPDMHEQVFEKFIRWRPRGYEDTPGSGLGLFVTRQIAREQGGDAADRGRSGWGYDPADPPAAGRSGARVTEPQVSLLICDDHKVLTDALATVVGLDPAFRLVAQPVHTPEEGVTIATEQLPDVVLMDIEFKGSGMTGIEATRRIKEGSPSTKVVIMTAHDDDRLMVEAVEAGASGFLSKDLPADEILQATKSAADGEVLIDPVTLTRLLAQVAREREERRDAMALLDDLTDRERQILELLAQGKRNDDIAAELYISPQTVQTHVRNILGKLRVHSKLEAVAFAVKNGAIQVT